MPFGIWYHARGRANCHGKPRKVQRNLIGYVRTRFDVSGVQLGLRRARGVLHLCAQESKVPTGRFLRETLIYDHPLYSFYEDH